MKFFKVVKFWLINAHCHAPAEDLAREAGSGQPWDGCLLLNNNAYFEQYIKSIFR